MRVPVILLSAARIAITIAVRPWFDLFCSTSPQLQKKRKIVIALKMTLLLSTSDESQHSNNFKELDRRVLI